LIPTTFFLEPDPLKCVAYGIGLKKAEVGRDAEFTLQLMNADDKNITTGGEIVDVQIKVLSFVSKIELVTCILNGHFDLIPVQNRLHSATFLN
jgi:hypothetical protein